MCRPLRAADSRPYKHVPIFLSVMKSDGLILRANILCFFVVRVEKNALLYYNIFQILFHNVVLCDKPFYDESGGGITISGGEPLAQYDFTVAVHKGAKAQGVHTAIETSVFSDRDLSLINSYTDLWLYDIKIFPEQEHIRYTGVSNKKIFENLH